MNSGKYLAIDLGAGSGRAIVGELKHNKIYLTEVHRFSNPIVKVFENIHWNFLHLLSEIKNSISNAIRLGHSDIESLGVDTWGVDFGLITKDGQLLGSPFAYRDSRTEGIILKANEYISNDEIYEATGIQFMQINTIFQLFSMVQSKNCLLNSASKLLFMPDLANYFLTGKTKTEYTIASTSQLLNANAKVWDVEIFTKLNLPIDIMAPIIEPGTKVGPLLSSICEPLGIKHIDVVAVGSHDTASAVAAVPNMGNNWAFISSGTWSLIGIETDSPIINEKSLKYNFTNEGGVGGKIRFLRNVMGMWIIQQLKIEWEKDGNEYDFETLNKLAQESAPFKCIIDTDDSKFLNPPSMIEAIHNFCNNTNQEIPVDKGAFVRAVLESLALKYRTIIDRINEFKEEKIDTINIVGGGSQNALLNQFTANATGLKVIVGPVEATAYGNLMLQGIANGKIESIESGRQIIKNSIEMETFLPMNQNEWNNFYLKAIELLKSLH